MGAFERFDTAAAKSADTTAGALFSDAYNSSGANANRGKVEGKQDNSAKSDNSGLPGVTLENAIDPDLKRKFDEAQQQEDLSKYDKNKDGKIDDKEYSTAINSSSDLSEIFRLGELRRYDKNHDGKVDEKEEKARTKDKLDAYFEELKKYDTNKDGKIDDAERAKQFDDILRRVENRAEEKPHKEEELKKEIDRGVEDLKKGIKANDLSAVIQDLEKAKATMPPEQYAKYLKAINDEFHKHNPNADIVGPFEQNGKHQLEVRSSSGDITVFVNKDEVKRALSVENLRIAK